MLQLFYSIPVVLFNFRYFIFKSIEFLRNASTFSFYLINKRTTQSKELLFKAQVFLNNIFKLKNMEMSHK
jgi:hypothetical protein